MSESLTIDFLYKTPVGRFILKGLVNPKVSKRAAKILSSRMSAAFVPSFIKKNCFVIFRIYNALFLFYNYGPI